MDLQGPDTSSKSLEHDKASVCYTLQHVTWQKYERLALHPVSDESSAASQLARVLTGVISVAAVVDTPEFQFSLGSPAIVDTVGHAGFRIGRTKRFTTGQNGTLGRTLGLHTDGELTSGSPTSVHVHTTTAGTALTRFIPMRAWPGIFPGEYLNRETEEVDTRYYTPLTYEIEAGVGTTLIFAVAGRTALAHEFTTQPTLLDHREFDFTTLERLSEVVVRD